MSIDAVAAWAGIFMCLSQSAMLSGLNLASFEKLWQAFVKQRPSNPWQRQKRSHG